MKKETTRDKIITMALALFNEKGISNVSLRMIGGAANISSGNITYYFKTKQELVRAVYLKMNETFAQIPFLDHLVFQGGKGLELIKEGFEYIFQFRFFYQDTMEVFRLDPGIIPLHEKEIERIQLLIANTNYTAVGKGILIPEPWEGYYAYLARNIWMTMQFWIPHQKMMNQATDDINEALRTVGAIIYPHYTEKGRAMYDRVIKELTN